jgi:hypothetical protein
MLLSVVLTFGQGLTVVILPLQKQVTIAQDLGRDTSGGLADRGE